MALALRLSGTDTEGGERMGGMKRSEMNANRKVKHTHKYTYISQLVLGSKLWNSTTTNYTSKVVIDKVNFCCKQSIEIIFRPPKTSELISI